MTAKCANPSCSAEFVYLHRGQVFVMKSAHKARTFSSRLNFVGEAEGLQYAWLCDECVSQYEVVLDPEGDLKVRSRYRFRGLLASLAGPISLYAASGLHTLSSFCDLSM